MHTQYFVVNHGCNGQAIEYILEFFPQLYAISPFALIIEAVNSINGPCFMIATKHEEVFFEFHLVCQEQYYCLK